MQKLLIFCLFLGNFGLALAQNSELIGTNFQKNELVFISKSELRKTSPELTHFLLPTGSIRSGYQTTPPIIKTSETFEAPNLSSFQVYRDKTKQKIFSQWQLTINTFRSSKIAQKEWENMQKNRLYDPRLQKIKLPNHISDISCWLWSPFYQNSALIGKNEGWRKDGKVEDYISFTCQSFSGKHLIQSKIYLRESISLPPFEARTQKNTAEVFQKFQKPAEYFINTFSKRIDRALNTQKKLPKRVQKPYNPLFR